MLQIRLLRIGKKHHPYYRLILVNKGKRPGKYLENLGFYSPTDKKNRVRNLETDKIRYWIAKGAQVTPTVHNILVAAKTIDKPKTKIKISKKKTEQKKADAGASAKPAETSAKAAENAQEKAKQPAAEAQKA